MAHGLVRGVAVSDLIVLSLDAEATRLHGPVFAVGAVVLDRHGAVLDTLALVAEPPEPPCAWVREHVLPLLEAMPKTYRPDDARCVHDLHWLHARTWEFLATYLALGAVVVADVPWPVEATLLSRCVLEHEVARAFKLYPLLDVESLVQGATGRVLAPSQDVARDLGLDPPDMIEDPRFAPYRPHNPLVDALVSGYAAVAVLRRFDRNTP